jgi:hypothetical protein
VIIVINPINQIAEKKFNVPHGKANKYLNKVQKKQVFLGVISFMGTSIKKIKINYCIIHCKIFYRLLPAKSACPWWSFPYLRFCGRIRANFWPIVGFVRRLHGIIDCAHFSPNLLFVLEGQ